MDDFAEEIESRNAMAGFSEETTRANRPPYIHFTEHIILGLVAVIMWLIACHAPFSITIVFMCFVATLPLTLGPYAS